MSRPDQWSASSPLNLVHSYVNVVERSDSEEPKPALPARNSKTRSKSGQRSSRSRERKEREARSDYEKIKEREKELERIHRRSRELMGSGRGEREREGGGRILEHHCRISAGGLQPGPASSGSPYFPPPPCHPPPPLSAAPGSHGRLKSSSPSCKEGGKSGQYNSHSMRRRVISPNRKDFRNFSHSQRGGRSTDEEDSGADSMMEVRSTHSSQSCRSWTAPSYQNSHLSLSLVPYDSHGSHGSHGGHSSCHSCCSSHHHQQLQQHSRDFPLAIPSSNIEQRLRALEDDKDKLHVQVAVMSDQLENQTDKITDLEKVLDDKKEALRKTEDVLQREILNKSSLETQKLELIAEITDVKVKLNSTERENQELRRRLAQAAQAAQASQAQQRSDSTADTTGSSTLPRRIQSSSQAPPLGVFRPFKLPERAEKPAEPEEPKPSFFRRSGSVRESRSKTSSRTRERDKSRESEDTPCPIATKPKGFKRILSRMRRANSGPIPQELKTEFETEKEAVRASAGSQLAIGWDVQKTFVPFESEVPFPDWDADIICAWFDSMGLYMYSKEVKKNVKTGRQLAAFTNTELEQKLGMESFLHRKKVLLAVMTRAQTCEDPTACLDHQWVTRWLDDVGLPQYKDAFLEARIDGRMLNFLTIDDLFQLKVTNQLHHLSIRRGIQVLRENNFEPACLKRRGAPGERDSQIVHSDVVFWTNHRSVDNTAYRDLSLHPISWKPILSDKLKKGSLKRLYFALTS